MLIAVVVNLLRIADIIAQIVCGSLSSSAPLALQLRYFVPLH